jgi:Rrf2 family protein
MFRLSKGSEYAIRGILYLSMQSPGKVCFIDEIADAQEVPRAYLAKIFQTLGKKGYLKSTRGPGGGFELSKSPEQINMLEIIETMEGAVKLNDCLISVGYCHRDETCAVHDVWKEAQDKFIAHLGSCTFAMLAVNAVTKKELNSLLAKSDNTVINQ